MLDTRVLSLGVLTDENGVDVVVSSLVTVDGNTWANVCEKGKGTTKSQVERDVTLADRGSEGTLESDRVLLDAVHSLVGDDSLAVLEDGCDVDLLPLNGGLECQLLLFVHSL